jgi:hypothetical protein
MSQKIVAAGEFVEQLRLLRSQLVTKELIVEFLSDRTIKPRRSIASPPTTTSATRAI